MIVVLLSGGIDSAVCLARAVEGLGVEQVAALHVEYNQPHKEESWHATRLARRFGVTLECLHACPWGRHLDGPGHDTDPMVIPGRNALFVALAAAAFPAADEIQLGCNADDQHGYFDCRPEFLAAMSAATQKHVVAPLASHTKAEVLAMMPRYGITIAETMSCYRGTRCGDCAACNLLRKGSA